MRVKLLIILFLFAWLLVFMSVRPSNVFAVKFTPYHKEKLILPNDTVLTKEKKKWTIKTFALQAKMKKLGFDENLSKYMINKCKEKAKNPYHCVITGAYIVYNESTAGNKSYKNNIAGINEGKEYSSRGAGFDRWIKSYNKVWYKAK